MPSYNVVNSIMPSQPFDDFDRLFDILSQQFSGMGWTVVDGSGARAAASTAVDVAAYDDHVVVVADLLGFSAADVDVTVAPRSLTLHARRAPAPFGASVTHEVTLPAGLDVDAATTAFNNGVFTVTLPVAAEDGEAEADADADTVIDIE